MKWIWLKCHYNCKKAASLRDNEMRRGAGVECTKAKECTVGTAGTGVRHSQSYACIIWITYMYDYLSHYHLSSLTFSTNSDEFIINMNLSDDSFPPLSFHSKELSMWTSTALPTAQTLFWKHYHSKTQRALHRLTVEWGWRQLLWLLPANPLFFPPTTPISRTSRQSLSTSLFSSKTVQLLWLLPANPLSFPPTTLRNVLSLSRYLTNQFLFFLQVLRFLQVLVFSKFLLSLANLYLLR